MVKYISCKDTETTCYKSDYMERAVQLHLIGFFAISILISLRIESGFLSAYRITEKQAYLIRLKIIES